MGDNIETNLLRPSIKVPDAESIFRIMLDDCDYQCEISDKGRYEAESIQKFGGLEKIGFALWSEKRRSLLRKFLETSSPGAKVHNEGVFLKDKRRYLNFAAIVKIFGDDQLSRDAIDEYIAKGILYRGYVFGCARCSSVEWFSIAEVDQTFTCRRCGTNQQYTQKSWRIPSEPSWFYKLDEMVYLMLSHNGHVPLLTLYHLRGEPDDSFLYTPELCLTPKGSTKMCLEIDVCCVANGRLCIGEAKSVDTLKTHVLTATQTADRYRDLALKLGVSMVVFSTSEPQWDVLSLDAIRTAFEKHPHIEVVILTSDHLFG